MSGYYGKTSSGIRDLISQMMVEMENIAEECKKLRSELSKKDLLLKQAEDNVLMLQRECRAARQDLAAAQEDKAKIASILGFEGKGTDAFPVREDTSRVEAYAPVSSPSGQAQADADLDLSDYASAALERMRELNRRVPSI